VLSFDPATGFFKGGALAFVSSDCSGTPIVWTGGNPSSLVPAATYHEATDTLYYAYDSRAPVTNSNLSWPILPANCTACGTVVPHDACCIPHAPSNFGGRPASVLAPANLGAFTPHSPWQFTELNLSRGEHSTGRVLPATGSSAGPCGAAVTDISGSESSDETAVSFTEFGHVIGKSASMVAKAIEQGRISRACVEGSRVIDVERARRSSRRAAVDRLALAGRATRRCSRSPLSGGSTGRSRGCPRPTCERRRRAAVGRDDTQVAARPRGARRGARSDRA